MTVKDGKGAAMQRPCFFLIYVLQMIDPEIRDAHLQQEREWLMIFMAKKFGVLMLCSAVLAGCQTVRQTTDKKTGIQVTTVAVRGCGNPSQTLTWVKRPGKKEDSYASTGGDLCNTAVAGTLGVVGQGVGSVMLPRSHGDTFQISSGSLSVAQQGTNVRIGGQ